LPPAFKASTRTLPTPAFMLLVTGLSVVDLLLSAGRARVSGSIEPGGALGSYVLTERASPLLGGGAEAGRTAMARACSFCRAHGQRLVPVGTVDVGWPVQRAITGPTGATLTFRRAARASVERGGALSVRLAPANLPSQDEALQQGLIATVKAIKLCALQQEGAPCPPLRPRVGSSAMPAA
jgi:hypothetical protein